MKRKIISAACLSLFLSLQSKAQVKDSSYNIRKIKPIEITEIEIFYNQYLQNGNNSAVTGGIGTEKLSVYAPGFQIKHSNKRHAWQLKGGTDIISSASTDNIDNVVSSASILDARTHVDLSYGISNKSKSHQLTFGTGVSIESDYFSRSFSLNAVHQSKDKRLEHGFNFQANFDDLRWGRLNPNYKKPVKLIYPVELRSVDWFDIKKRNSFTLKYHISSVVNRTTLAGISFSLATQNGLLSTPFHRVYLKDSTLLVEKLPNLRNKLSLALKLNKYLGYGLFNRAILEAYSDDWGIQSIAFENELAIKLSMNKVLTPFFRIYTQKQAKYFAQYREHLASDKFYTSDYDLSQLNTLKLGLDYKYNRSIIIFRRLSFKSIEIRYSYYIQNNGLFAHVFSMNMKFENNKMRKK